MTAGKLHAIEMVMMFNADIAGLLEKRGVSRDDLREVFKLARVGHETVELSNTVIAEVIAEELASIPTTEEQVAEFERELENDAHQRT